MQMDCRKNNCVRDPECMLFKDVVSSGSSHDAESEKFPWRKEADMDPRVRASRDD